MAIIERIPIIENPVLLDLVIGEIQKGLAWNISWLDYAFGKAERLVKMQGNKRVYSPNVYAGGNQYLPVCPDSNIGNFCFFTIEDPQTVNWMPKIRGEMSVNYGLIFWFDFRRLFPGQKFRSLEPIKAEILKVLNGGFWLRSGRITVTQIEERAENIYKGYSLDEVENQFLMHPFGGLRFDGKLIINESC